MHQLMYKMEPTSSFLLKKTGKRTWNHFPCEENKNPFILKLTDKDNSNSTLDYKTNESTDGWDWACNENTWLDADNSNQQHNKKQIKNQSVQPRKSQFMQSGQLDLPTNDALIDTIDDLFWPSQTIASETFESISSNKPGKKYKSSAFNNSECLSGDESSRSHKKWRVMPTLMNSRIQTDSRTLKPLVKLPHYIPLVMTSNSKVHQIEEISKPTVRKSRKRNGDDVSAECRYFAPKIQKGITKESTSPEESISNFTIEAEDSSKYMISHEPYLDSEEFYYDFDSTRFFDNIIEKCEKILLFRNDKTKSERSEYGFCQKIFIMTQMFQNLKISED